MSVEDRSRVGLVGYGRWGEVWARVLHAEGILAWIVDSDAVARSKARAKYVADGLPIHEEIPPYDLTALDGAVVATPPDSHAEVSRYLLAERVPVLLEKPMATDAETVGGLVAAARDTGTRLMPGHTFLHSHPVQVARKWTKERLGQIRSLRLTWENTSTTRQEGALWNLGPHAFSVACALLEGEELEIESVRGLGVRLSPDRPDVRDVADVTIVTDRVGISVHLANFGAEKVREFVVVGDEGAVVCRPTQAEVVHHPWRGKIEYSYGAGEEPMAAMVRRFLDPAPLASPFGEDGLLVTQLLAAAESTIETEEART